MLALDISANQLGFGFGWRDAQSELGHWSPQLRRMVGLPEQGPVPTREEFVALVDPADRARVAAEITSRPAVGSVRAFEYDVVLPGVARRTLMTRVVLRPDAGRQPWRYYFVVIDLADSRARERRMVEMAQRLQLASEASGIGTWDRDLREPRANWDAVTKALFGLAPDAPTPLQHEFMAMVHPDDRAHLAAEVAAHKAHIEYEFRITRPDGRVRWPLNAVPGFAQVLALDAKEPLSAAQRARVGHIQTAGWHLLALINDVLDLARIESRQAVLNPQRLALGEVVDECLAMNAAAAAAAGIEQRVLPAAGDLPPAWADRTRVHQVLLNLVSNAVKYNIAVGHVAVSLARRSVREAMVSVADTGPGLSALQLEHLFEPFNRLGRENGLVEGTGIGLTLSRLIAQQMGGRVEVQTQPGAGSTFSLVLPVAGADGPVG